MPTTTDDAIDGIMPTGPLKTGYVGYRDFFPDIPAFGTEYDVDRMSTVFDPSGSFQSDQDILNMLASAYPSESAEQIADRLQSLTANTAMARQFGGAALDPYSQLTATATPPADDTNILDTIKSIPGAAVDAAKSAADTLLKQIQEFLPFYDQSQVVINPRTGQATIVFGTPPSGSPVIQAGNLPKSNTNVGITTGISILDEAINSVLGKEGGLSSGSIRDEVVKVIFKQAGIDPAAAAVILGDDWGTVLANANTKAAETLSRFSIDLTGEKDGVVRNTGSRTSTDLGEDTTVKGGGTDVVKTGAADAVDIVTGAGDSSVVTGAGDSSVVTGAGDSSVVTGAADSVIKTGSLTPADLGEGTTVKTGGGTDVIKTGGGGGGGTATPATPLYGQGIRSMKTEKAGVTPLEDVFDIGDMSLANVLRLLAGEDDNTQGTPYYGGGSVNRNSSVDELIRLLRG